MPDEIRAKRFVIIDDEGRRRAQLGMEDGGVALELFAPDEDLPAVVLRLEDNGNTHLRLKRQGRIAELQVSERKVSLKLSDEFDAKSSCGMSVDEVGAWMVAEASPDVGVRILSKNDGQVTFLWLSETFAENDETYVRTRYLRADPREDKTSGWQTTC